MKRMTWMGLPLAFVLGCHHNLVPDSHGVPECKSCSHSSGHCGHGAPVTDQMMRRFSNTRTQVAFLSPMGMSIGWEAGSGAGRTFMPAMLTVPGRFNFEQAAIYRLKVSNVNSRPGVSFYPTLEIAPSSPRTDAYLTHNAVPIEFTDEDFEQASAGNFVTKVLYLPDPQHQELAIAGVETLVSTRLDPGVDPIAEADRRGTILAIVRLGGIDLEMPQAMNGMGVGGGEVIQMANGTVPIKSQVVVEEPAGRAAVRR